MADIILSAQNISKRYGEVVAVNDLSFSIKAGTCFGLLGPNGAGKTTTIELLEGIQLPDTGQVLFRGQPISRDYAQRIGIQFQSTALQDFLTVRESLALFATLYHHHLPLEQLIEDCSLSDFIDRDNRKLSGGQRQRLLLAIALVNDPDLIFLDEPTTGLDPQARRHFWELIERIKGRGKSILLTTHYMDEAEFLCDEIAIVDAGAIVEQGTPRDLLTKHFEGSLIKLPRGTDLSALSISPPLIDAGDFVQFSTEQVGEAVKQLAAEGVPLDGLRIESPTLEDLFLLLTGHSLRV
ncbi:ABC transporter ATP-binding protein [Umboniibacter marinipuniceus]|uniref:ABC-2 type transport system ATP-binding protein n=1 Tax=Umboniibacter marinipuniceus TaxID=569599 RepID=A0A3M0A578_9GAMM|nr:ABC transporter ATP-binding protein [Umboniibacter marinipuniceus]RMA77625.1 ABC-2 type transport system ATP-binding protein [Umboniibacter marinipuniceus]